MKLRALNRFSINQALRATIWNIVSLGSTQIISLISFSYLSRRLSIRDYGELATIQSLMSVTWPLIGMGMVSGVITSQVRDSAEQAKVRMTLSVLTWIGITLIALCVLAPFFHNIVPFLGVPVYFLDIAIIGGLGTLFNITTTGVFRAKHSTFNAVKVEILVAAITLVSTYVFFDLAGKGSVETRMLAVVIGFLAPSWILISRIKDELRRSIRSRKLLLGYLGVGWPLVLHSLSGWFTGSMDRLVLTKFHGPEVTGNYAVSAQVGGMFGLFTVLIGQVWSPTVFSQLRKGDSAELHRLLRQGKALAVLLPIFAIAFAFVAPLIFKYILSKNYTIDPAIVLATSIKGAFDGWYYLVSAPLFFYEYNKQITAVTLGIGFLTALFLWIAGRNLDGLGVAATLAISTLAQSIVIWLLTWRYRLWRPTSSSNYG